MSMYNSSQYNAAASAFAGSQAGGFMGSQSPAVGTPATGSKAFVDKYMLPVTVRMLESAERDTTGSNLIVNGEQVGLAWMVALVLQIEVKDSFTNYVVDDSTGNLNVRKWQEADETAAQIRENTYVRIVGKVSVFNEKVQFNAHVIKPILSSNEITHHLISAMHSHLDNQRSRGQTTAPSVMAANVAKIGNQPSMDTDPEIATEMAEWTDCQRAVYKMVEQLQTNDNNGAHLPHIFKALPQFTQQQIREAVCSLTDEGQLYDTVSEEYFKTSES